MVVHEIAAIRKGSTPNSRAIELNILKNEWKEGEGPRIQSSLHIENTREGLEEMFGEDFDVGTQYELVEMRFSVVEPA